MKTTKRKVKSPVKAPPQRAAGAAPAVSTPLVALGSHCTVKDGGALKDRLCKVAHEDSIVAVDVAAIERIDTATLQILCAFARDRAAHDRKVAFRGNSPAWREAVRLLGIGALLGSSRTGLESAA